MAKSAATSRLSLHLTVNTLALKRGGLVRAVMRRASSLAAGGEYAAVWIEVLGFQPRLEEDVESLRLRRHLHPGVQVRQLLSALDPSRPGRAAGTGLPDRPDEVAVPVRTDPQTVRYLRDGVLARQVRRTAEGRLLHVDHFDQAHHRHRRDEHGPDGRLLRVQHFGPGDQPARSHRWIGRDGRCYLVVWPDPGTGDWETVHVLGDEPRELTGAAQLYQLAFERALADEAAPVVFSEFRENLPNLPGGTLDDVVQAVRHPRLRTVAVGHSNHLRAPYRPEAGATPHWDRLLTHLADWDRLVLLTEQQQADVQEAYPTGDRVRVVPQVVGPARLLAGPVDPDRVVLVARIHRKKRVDEAVRAFRLVVDSRPGARLEIYGFGYGDPLEAAVRQLVVDLDLTSNVRFCGFESSTEVIYRGACATWLTSASEGFPLALLESLAHGVPVLAYDIRYGPRDVLTDGVNGALVPDLDRAALAARTLDLMGSPELRGDWGKAATASVVRFDQARQASDWQAVLAELAASEPIKRAEPETLGRAWLVPPFELGRAIWVGQRLRLEVGVPAGAVSCTLVVRTRGRTDDEVREVVVDGGCTVDLGRPGAGQVRDLFLDVETLDEHGAARRTERRLAFGGAGSDGPLRGGGWQVYRTVQGSVSAGQPPPTAVRLLAQAPGPARRLLRRGARLVPDRWLARLLRR
jgi:poly(glycerol-phosphate) alpha-glucosyltransferase